MPIVAEEPVDKVMRFRPIATSRGHFAFSHDVTSVKWRHQILSLLTRSGFEFVSSRRLMTGILPTKIQLVTLMEDGYRLNVPRASADERLHGMSGRQVAMVAPAP